MQFIEFNGLPGCGKSTVSLALKDVLEKQSREVYLFSDVMLKFPTGTLNRLAFCIQKWNIIEAIKLYRIAACANGGNLRVTLRRIVIAENICASYRALSRTPGICIVDQGILQAILSIIHTHEVSDKEKLKSLATEILSCYSDVFYVNAGASEKTARERIRHRNFCDGSRLNFIFDDNELEGELAKLTDSLLILRSLIEVPGFSGINITMDRSVQDNSRIIAERLFQEER